MIVGVIGAGAWGTALAITAARGGAQVALWSYDGAAKVFDGIELPESIRLTKNMADLSNADVWLIVTPAAYFRETVRAARGCYKGCPVIICTKGAEYSTGCFMSEILRTELSECHDYGVLSGPQFASEVACNVPTGSTLAGTPMARQIGAAALNRLYISESDDIIGAEMCGVGKNAVALICGYTSVKCGENERALIFTRAWGEVVKVAMALGAKEGTFLDLCGIGDLFLSATSPTSRNFAAGMAIADGRPIEGTVEGVFALAGILARAADMGIDTPVLAQMSNTLNL
ncbi:MAG: hypothetical protein K2I81_00845 [Alphaproteobacteria bacterium]|nr:hypothetical protein [Alphaproteobacteria bacterium]